MAIYVSLVSLSDYTVCLLIGNALKWWQSMFHWSAWVTIHCVCLSETHSSDGNLCFTDQLEWLYSVFAYWKHTQVPAQRHTTGQYHTHTTHTYTYLGHCCVMTWCESGISTHYNEMCSEGIMLYCSVRKGFHWQNPYLNISFIYWGSQSLYSFVTGVHWVGILICIKLGMRYEAEICTIVINMNRTFESFCCMLYFEPKLRKTVHGL